MLWEHSALLTGDCSRSCHSVPPFSWSLVQHTWRMDAGFGVLALAPSMCMGARCFMHRCMLQ